jgi:hypothetical protein
MADNKTKNPPANENKPGLTMTFDELVERSGLDEDTLLQRIAGVLAKREPGVDPV